MAGSRPRTLKPFEDFSILTSSIEERFRFPRFRSRSRPIRNHCVKIARVATQRNNTSVPQVDSDLRKRSALKRPEFMFQQPPHLFP
jgi:hypothetical protein